MVKMSDKQNVIELKPYVEGCCDPVPVRIPAGTDEQVKLLAALSDSTRLQIVAMLAGQDEPLCVCDIQGNFILAQPTISHHLRILRDAHLVTWEKRGLWVYYSLDRATLERATAYLSNLLSLSKSALPAG
jgi:ArsR family transcriptional regulator, arsenate/arsenite/antimonite-responsive transcriptional repressor